MKLFSLKNAKSPVLKPGFFRPDDIECSRLHFMECLHAGNLVFRIFSSTYLYLIAGPIELR